MKSFNILGIDQSIANSGYCLIDQDKNLKAYGNIKTKAKLGNHIRVKQIYDSVKELIEKYKPDALSIEDTYLLAKSEKRGFKGKSNPKTLKVLNQVRGVIMLLAAQYDIELRVYASVSAKLAVTGSGRATKEEVQEAVFKMYGDLNFDDNVADSIALALTMISEVENEEDK